MTLNIGQYDYMKDLGGSAGVRVVVHPQARMPFPKDEGVVAAPGQMTLVGIRQVILTSKCEECMSRTKLRVCA